MKDATKDFCLSNKITPDLYKLGYEDDKPVSGLDVEDVKEFIRLLKLEFREGVFINDFMVSIKEIETKIDKLAGENLLASEDVSQ